MSDQGTRQDQKQDSTWTHWRAEADRVAEACRGQLRDAEARIRKELKHAVPPEARVRLRNGKREILTGLRDIIDHQLNKQPPGPSAPKAPDHPNT